MDKSNFLLIRRAWTHLQSLFSLKKPYLLNTIRNLFHWRNRTHHLLNSLSLKMIFFFSKLVPFFMLVRHAWLMHPKPKRHQLTFLPINVVSESPLFEPSSLQTSPPPWHLIIKQHSRQFSCRRQQNQGVNIRIKFDKFIEDEEPACRTCYGDSSQLSSLSAWKVTKKTFAGLPFKWFSDFKS